MNGVFLEVIAEAEISQHFEEGMVACGVADLVKIIVFAASPHTALRTDGTSVAAFLGTEKHILELHHAGIGEQQGRIIAGNQRAAGHYGMAFTGKEIQEILADLRTRARRHLCHGQPEAWDAAPNAPLHLDFKPFAGVFRIFSRLNPAPPAIP